MNPALEKLSLRKTTLATKNFNGESVHVQLARHYRYRQRGIRGCVRARAQILVLVLAVLVALARNRLAKEDHVPGPMVTTTEGHVVVHARPGAATMHPPPLVGLITAIGLQDTSMEEPAAALPQHVATTPLVSLVNAPIASHCRVAIGFQDMWEAPARIPPHPAATTPLVVMLASIAPNVRHCRGANGLEEWCLEAPAPVRLAVGNMEHFLAAEMSTGKVEASATILIITRMAK